MPFKGYRNVKMASKLIFDEVEHTYTINGKLIPSVSLIVGLMLGDNYKGIPMHILNKASQFGSDVHKFIELYNETSILEYKNDYKILHCVSEWVRLSEEFDEIIESEQSVHYMELYAGTFDSIALKGKKRVLIDYKTTNKFHRERVTLQLNLYRIAYQWLTGKKIDELCCVWLPKHTRGKIIYLDILEEYELIEKVEGILNE